MKKLLSSTLAVVFFLAAAGASAAPDDPRFGDRGTLAISGRASIGSTVGGDQYALRAFNAQPVVAWFFAEDVSIALGGLIGWDKQTNSGPTQTDVTRDFMYGGSLAIGRLIRLGDRVGLWPQLEVHRVHVTTTFNGTESPSNSVGLGASLPLVFAVSDHLYATLTIGEADLDWWSSGDHVAHSSGLSIATIPRVGIGGWF